MTKEVSVNIVIERNGMPKRPIKVVVCYSRAGAPSDDHSDILNRFDCLGVPVKVQFHPYEETADSRSLRGAATGSIVARSMIAPPDRALCCALRDANVVLALDLPFGMEKLAPRLAWVQAASAGVDHLMATGLERTSVRVTTAAGIGASSIAEFVMGRIVAHWKHFAHFERQQRQHRWEPMYGRSLSGSSIAIIGLGSIGNSIARRAHSWEMRVLASRRTASTDQIPFVDRFYDVSEWPAMLAEADAAVLCLPASSQTLHLFDRSLFSAMKEGSFFCNVARGSLVDERALRDALLSGHLSGAAIDVAEQEPLSPDSPLWDVPNLMISPHSAVSLDRYVENLWDLFFDNMRRFVAGIPLRNLHQTGRNIDRP